MLLASPGLRGDLGILWHVVASLPPLSLFQDISSWRTQFNPLHEERLSGIPLSLDHAVGEAMPLCPGLEGNALSQRLTRQQQAKHKGPQDTMEL